MSYPHIATPTPSASELARRAENDERLHIQQRVRQIQSKIVDACESFVDRLTQAQETRARACGDERRQYANMLHAAEFCARGRCRRTHSCQGEPAHCLRVLLPAIGLERAADLIAKRKRPKRAPRNAR